MREIKENIKYENNISRYYNISKISINNIVYIYTEINKYKEKGIDIKRYEDSEIKGIKYIYDIVKKENGHINKRTVISNRMECEINEVKKKYEMK